MSLKKIWLYSVAATVFLTVPSLAMAEIQKMTLRFATANPIGSHHVETLEKFKEILEKESNGNIKVDTFYGGSLGDEQANVKQLRNTEIHAAVLAGGNLTPFAPAANIYFMPYLFPKSEDAKTLLGNKEFNSVLADTVAKQSAARPLGWVIGGYRVITNSKRPIKTMADMKDLKIRVPAVEVQLEAFRSWGVEPHPLAWSETFNALQQGVVDGQENPHTVNRDQKFWEVQEFITNNNYMLWVGPLLVSEKWYRRLNAETKALVNKAADEAIRHVWAWNDVEEQKALDACLANGMKINDLDNEQEWIDAARGVWPKFYDKVGGKERLDQALKIMGQ